MSHDVQTPLVGIRIVGRDIIEYGRDGFIIMNEEYSLLKKKIHHLVCYLVGSPRDVEDKFKGATIHSTHSDLGLCHPNKSQPPGGSGSEAGGHARGRGVII